MIYLVNLYINLQLRKMCVLGSCFLLRGVTASVFTETPTPTGKIKKHLLLLPVLFSSCLAS